MSEFNTNAAAKLNRIAAKDIEEKMRPLRMSPTENSKRRWVWELIQNAKDKAAIDFPEEKVSILISLNQDTLEFCHNFGYFSTDNVEGLIYQISSEDKDRDETDSTEPPKATGRFGTGFMTTHLLSEKVNVKGFYKNKDGYLQKIKFPLDRSGRQLMQLISSIEESFECAEDSLIKSPKISKVNFKDLNTTFQYELNEKGKKTAHIGINDLKISLPYTLLFVDRIKSVMIKNNGENLTYDKKNIDNLTDTIRIVEIERQKDNQIDKLYFVHLSKGLTNIAIQVKKDKEKIYIKPFDRNIPKIFLDFPLIGTERFNFPVIVNNPFFEPTEPRDGVFLTDEVDEHIINNKKIINEAIELYFVLLNYAIASQWENLYILARTDLPEEKDWISGDWYKNEVQSTLRAKLLKAEVVDTDNPEKPRIAIENALFPYHRLKETRLKIWELTNPIHRNRLPKKEHIEAWYEIIRQPWYKKSWEEKIRYELENLVNHIHKLLDIGNLAKCINKTNEETFAYLNQVIEFVVGEKPELLEDYAIIPNQYDVFKNKDNLHTDDRIPEELKDVLKTLNKDWREILKSRKISDCILSRSKKIDDIVNDINKVIKQIKQEDNSNIKDAVLLIVSCFPNAKDIPKRRDSLWNFARDFYRQELEKRVLENWIPSIWEEADKWLITNLCAKISQVKSVAALTNHLNQDGLEWLGNFATFLISEELDEYLNKYTILPNQNGDFEKKKFLFVDQDIDDSLKDILGRLGYDCRSELLENAISIDLDGKVKTSKDIAQEIRERVQEILGREGIRERTEENKEIFSDLLVWFHEKERLAKDIFGNLYEKRHRLRSDEEIIADIKLRQDLENNQNNYTMEEILNLVNTPRENYFEIPSGLSKDKLEEILRKYQDEKDKEINKTDYSYSTDIDSLLISLGVATPEEFEKAKQKFAANKEISAKLHSMSNYSRSEYFSKLEYVLEIIERAKENVKKYLSNQDNYNCESWHEESLTVIAGVTKDGKNIKVVVRPSDGGQVILYYPSEFDALEKPYTEFWVDDGTLQEQVTLGKVLKRMEITWIPW